MLDHCSVIKTSMFGPRPGTNSQSELRLRRVRHLVMGEFLGSRTESITAASVELSEIAIERERERESIVEVEF